MSAGRYTELFFLDEAVAFAAGHRACAECRRPRFNAFRTAWKRWSSPDGAKPPAAEDIDAELHRARIGAKSDKVIYEAFPDSLPDGCFVRIGGSSYLVRDKSLLLWSPDRYIEKKHWPQGVTVEVLTPQPIVRCFREGYVPEMHESSLTS